MEIKKEKFLMGTEVEIIINPPLTPPCEGGEFKMGEDIEYCFDIFKNLEKEFSRFNKNSVLSKLNTLKSLDVSERFRDVLELSREIYNKTEGYFNPLINISTIGYSNSFKDNNFTQVEIEQNLDLNSIEIVGNTITLQQNQNLDFGAIVKGYTVDRVKDFLEDNLYTNFIINAGGDMYVSKKSTISIDSPENNGDIFALLELENTSFSTSGTYKRKWKIDGKSFHHILNPEKNSNNNEIASISLITNECYLGDAYATACIAMGIEKSREFLGREKIEGIIIGTDEKVYKIGDMKQYNFEII